MDLRKGLSSCEHPVGRTRLAVGEGQVMQPLFMCCCLLLKDGCAWRLCCHQATKDLTGPADAVTALGGTWKSCHWGVQAGEHCICLGACRRGWWQGCKEVHPGARQKQKSRNLPCTCSYSFDTLVTGVPGGVHAGGENPWGQTSSRPLLLHGHVFCPITQLDLRAEGWKGTIKSFIFCPAAPGNPGLAGLF